MKRMKSHLTKVSLALLSAAFMLGCQEQGSEPVGLDGLGPEFSHKLSHNPGGSGGGGGGGGGTVPVDITVTGGLATETFPGGGANHQVVGFKNQPAEIELSGLDPEITLAFNMANTHAAGREDCVQGGAGDPTPNELNALFDVLLAGVHPIDFFFVGIDKTVLDGDGSSENHLIAANGPITIGGTTHLFRLVPLTVFQTGNNITDPGGLTFVFTGGSIVVGNQGKKGTPQDNFSLLCLIQDDITMKLTSPPSG